MELEKYTKLYLKEDASIGLLSKREGDLYKALDTLFKLITKLKSDFVHLQISNNYIGLFSSISAVFHYQIFIRKY